MEVDAKAERGTNPPSDTLPAPVKNKRIISQMLPFLQGWLSLLSAPRNLLPLSPFPCHQEAQFLILLATTGYSPTHTHSVLERGEGGKGLSDWVSCPGAASDSWVQSQHSLAPPRSENHNRFSVGLLGLHGRSCALLSYYKAQLYIK